MLRTWFIILRWVKAVWTDLVVLQCLPSPNRCEILKLQGRANELCDPCTVLFVLFIDVTIQHCWKNCIISSINIHFYYLNPVTIIMYYVSLDFMQMNGTFFYSKDIFKKSPILAIRATTNNQSLQPSGLGKLEESLVLFFRYIGQQYYISHVLHALIWHKKNALHIGYGSTAMTLDG